MDIYDPKYKKISVGVLISLIFAFTFIAFLIIAAKNKKTGNIAPTAANQEEEKNKANIDRQTKELDDIMDREKSQGQSGSADNTDNNVKEKQINELDSLMNRNASQVDSSRKAETIKKQTEELDALIKK
jgi:hypothetical protein